MLPGRELDALIAEKIFGLEVVRSKKGTMSIGEPDWQWERFEGTVLMNPVLEYSTNIANAFEAVEALKKAGWYFSLYDYGAGGSQYKCVFDSDEDIITNELVCVGIGSTPAEAICLAALKTKE